MSRPHVADIPTGTTITEISPLPSDPNVQRIKVAGRVAARLHGSDVASLGIEPGQQWTEELAARVAHCIQLSKARKTALNALSRRSLSRGELIERLTRRGYEQDIAEQAADQLEADGWVDDAAYGREVAESLLRKQPASHRLIVHKLIQRRIGRDLAEQIAAELLAETDPVEQAMTLAEKRFRAMGDLSPQTTARRIAGLLARRGYDAETTRQVIARLGILDEDG